MKGSVQAILKPLTYIALAISLTAISFQLIGYSSPLLAESILEGAVGSPDAITNSVRWALPLLVTSLGVVVAFRSGFFNVGAQGQFYAGAIAVAFVVYPLEGLPPAIMTPAAVCAGIAGGALWALCPAILRLTYGTDEVITTLMGNFIAALALIEVTTGVLKDPAGTGQSSSTRPIDAVYRWSDATGVSTTLILVATVCVVVLWILLNRTSFGVLAGLAGRNPTMLVWQGATEWRLGCAAFLVSGGMAGLAGAMEVLGPNGQLISDFLPTDGFTAILIALVGGLSVPGSLIASLFFGGLAAATLYLPIMAGLPSSAVDVINAVIAILITARAWPKGFERLLMFMSPAHD